MDRPQGVSIVSAVGWIAGTINVVVGLGYVFTLLIPYASVPDQPSALGLLLVGVVWLAIAYGFWVGASWARTIGLLWAGISILAGVWVLVTHLSTFSDVLVPVLGSILLPLVILWYLRQDQVKEWFEVTPAAESELRRS